MKILVAFTLFCLFGFQLHAQLVIKHDTVWYPNFPTDNIAHGKTDTIVNLGTGSSTVTWNRANVVLQSGWTCSFVDDIYASYGCADTTTHSVTIHPNQPGVFWVNMKATSTASSSPVIVTLNTSIGTMTYVFGIGALGVNYTNNEEIQVYPQPFQHELRFKGDLSNVSTIELRNIFGQLVYRADTKHQASPVISTTALSSGLYFLTLWEQDRKSTVYKLLKD